jgi:hypothetical protein
MYFHSHSHLSAGYAQGIILHVEVSGENCTGVFAPSFGLALVTPSLPLIFFIKSSLVTIKIPLVLGTDTQFYYLV